MAAVAGNSTPARDLARETGARGVAAAAAGAVIAAASMMTFDIERERGAGAEERRARGGGLCLARLRFFWQKRS